MTSKTSLNKSPERASGPVILPTGAAGWALLALAAAVAGCAAATVQPADFTARQGAAYVLIALAAVVCSFAAARVGIAWPLTAGLGMAAAYRLAYDPVLPEAIMAHMPMRLALLEPTVPMAVALLAVLLWAVWPRRGDEVKAAGGAAAGLDGAVAEALVALRRTAQIAVGLGLVMYVALSGVYDLEGGYWFWRLTLSAALYLGLMWIGVEGAARRMLTPAHAAVLFAGVLISVGRSLVALAAGGGG